jgi:PAS domain S-box-containing protein
MHSTLLDRLYGSSPAFIYLTSLQNHRIVYASPNMTQLLGYGHKDFIGKDHEEMQDLFAAEDKDKVIKADLKFLEMLSSPPGQQVKCVITARMERSNGNLIPVQQQKVVLEYDSSGRPALVMTMIMDITCGGKKNPDFCSAILIHDPVKGWTEIASAGTSCNDKLSNREKEILLLLSKGKSSKVIASELDISVNTVNNHRKNMLLKTKTGNIAGLLSYSISQGII